VLTTNDDSIAERLRVLRNQGMATQYEYITIGHNWRMSDIAAAVAVPQLRRIAETIAKRQDNARQLSELIADLPVTAPSVPQGFAHVWHQYTVVLPKDLERSEVVSRMAKQGVRCGVYYPKLVWDYEPFRNHPNVIKGRTEKASEIASRVLSLPIHNGLGQREMEQIANAFRLALA